MNNIKKEIKQQRITLVLNFITFACFAIAGVLLFIRGDYFVACWDFVTALLWIIKFSISYKPYKKNIKKIHMEKNKEILDYYLKK